MGPVFQSYWGHNECGSPVDLEVGRAMKPSHQSFSTAPEKVSYALHLGQNVSNMSVTDCIAKAP